MRITILARTELGSDESFDDAIGQVAAALRRGGHRISILGIQYHIGKLISAMKRRQPDLIFNLIRPPEDDGPCGIALMGLMDLLGVPYTGSGPAESMIQNEPSIVRALLGVELRMPISKNGNGHDPMGGPTERPPRAANGRVKCASDYRAFRVGVLGNDEPTTFPPIEICHAQRNRCVHAPADAGSGLCKELQCDLQHAARAACAPLKIRDYAMMDLRMNQGDQIRITGVSQNCDLTQSGDYAQMAAAAGIDFVPLVNRIVELAFERAEQRQLSRLI